MKVLIADDDPGTRRVLQNQVEAWGYTAVLAADGHEAWERLLEQDAPRLALLDWMMPRLDGVTLCERLREREKDHFVYAVLMTMRTGAKDLVFALENGAHVFLRKPLNLDELSCQIRIGERLVKAYDKNVEYAKRLETLATIDPLTGIFNRRSWFSRAEQEVSRARRMKHPLSLMFLDLDRFKEINDTHGHLTGDRVICAVIAKLREKLRDYDIFGRVGGEEFVVLLPEAAMKSAREVAQRACDACATIQIKSEHGLVFPTASFGVAELTGEGDTLDALLRRADKAMYQAKRDGRNRVSCAPLVEVPLP